ncbi:MAG: DUF86 domain-containing protein [Runella slithyformis]|nr:MAG: DUF86 domain-containing protein [Runella slithyformis]TAE90890.1 MAG: DUF86 domain-containing protein [Runella slithyformis]TAF23035.1 MAG: DUF86 domain-containing protein [Runella slithyformis]TAF49208.1 MAG: DUF86 domain-containing protein [Runella slithyformis]TAF80787.1 MAG: DUF86 domain-containing protein [Runella slithyformis]
MKGELGDKARLQHIYEAIVEIESYTQGVDIEEFIGNSMMRFACLKQIEIIGEAANHISIATQERFEEIDWRQMVGLRNILVHEYFGIINRLIWDVIHKDIPELKNKIENILNQI